MVFVKKIEVYLWHDYNFVNFCNRWKLLWYKSGIWRYIDSEGIQGNFLRQWKYSVSWQGWWLYGGMYLSGLTELYKFNILCIYYTCKHCLNKVDFFKLIQLTLEPCLSTSVFVFFPVTCVTTPFTIESFKSWALIV